MRIDGDYHTHTVYSHGKNTVEENVVAAIAKGLSRIAISEHASAHFLYGLRGEALRSLRREIDDAARKYASQIEVLMGYECNVTAYGECDAPTENSAMFDVLLLGYHKGVLPKDAFTRKAMFEAFSIGKGDSVKMAESLLIAADKHKITMLSHPCEYVRADIPTLAKGAGELGILLEINNSHVSLTVEELKEAARYGAKFIIGSDAHRKEDVGNVTRAVAAAEAAGVWAENAIP